VNEIPLQVQRSATSIANSLAHDKQKPPGDDPGEIQGLSARTLDSPLARIKAGQCDAINSNERPQAATA